MTARLVNLARRHLPPAVAERWIAQIRPALRLRACGPRERQVGQLGGEPVLPDDVAWPEWEGSLNFVASIDCGRLPGGLDIALPDSGTLLFFYFDDEVGYHDPSYVPPTVGSWNPDSAAGARVLHVPSGAPERETPLDIQPYEYVPLTAKPAFTGPDWLHPAFREACRDVSDADQAFLADHANGDAFVSALRRLTPSPRHQLGGHSIPVQDAAETATTTLLAQFDSDDEADMRWGDLGTLFWLIKPDDLAAGAFAAASFTWQCT